MTGEDVKYSFEPIAGTTGLEAARPGRGGPRGAG